MLFYNISLTCYEAYYYVGKLHLKLLNLYASPTILRELYPSQWGGGGANLLFGIIFAKKLHENEKKLN